jgi:tetratricopeptide (TPR) repeat protein
MTIFLRNIVPVFLHIFISRKIITQGHLSYYINKIFLMMSSRFKKAIIAFHIILIAIALGGCSTKKNTTVSRAFHNLTSKYNYYFNAKESYSNAIKKVQKDFDYNYTFPLPVMLVGDKQVASKVGGDMDRAITKCTNMISHHSITVKPERKSGSVSAKDKKFYSQNEFVRWVREGWLLIGKARVWKGTYDEARMTFEHILVQFPETPMWYESQVWLAKIDIITGDFVSAEDRLSSLSANRKYPKDKYFTHLLESTWAGLYQKQKNIPQTIKHLDRALDNAPDRAHKLRYTYLLAQYNQSQQDFAESNKHFRKVIKMSPSYEMSFNARVNIAQNFQGGSGGQEMIRSLLKMAKDEKNSEFLDQIYYALGNIEKSKDNIDKAIEYYQLSASKSVRNNHQKGLSYLVIADFFFAKPNYTVSQAYYDSAYNALDDDFPGYSELETKTLNLNKLVENLNIVNLEDSLQRIAAMTSKERDVIIAELIKKVREDEDQLRREEQEGRDRFAQFQNTQRGRPQESQGGSWYFYNQSSLSYGLSEFQMRWGRRKLEDNWRRANKRVVLDQTTTLTQATTDSTGMPAKVLDNKSREFYLQDLPLTDSLVAISNNRIQEALFRVGEIYENDLKDYPEAIKAYELLGTRFPQSNYSLSAYYNLYQISRFNQKPADMEKYKQTIVSRFPTSTYALMLSNPKYLENLQKENKEMEDYYQQTYNLFQQGNCTQASAKAKEGKVRYKDTDLVPKFLFIEAQCVGRTGDLRAYKNALSDVVKLYPESEVAKSAANIIVFIDKRELQLAATTDPATITTPDEVKVSVIYKQPKGQHLFLAIVPKQSPLNQLKFNVVNFNVDYYIDLNLNVANRELTEFVELITVEPFKDRKEAMEYYQKAVEEQGLMGALAPNDYTLTVISRENLEIFLKDKSVAEYLNYFRATYLK